jgi:hypothetical protein
MPSINFIFPQGHQHVKPYPAINQTIYSPTKNNPKTPTSISNAIFTIGFAPSPALGTAVDEAAAEPLAVVPLPLELPVEPVEEVVEELLFIAKALNASKVLLPLVGLPIVNITIINTSKGCDRERHTR